MGCLSAADLLDVWEHGRTQSPLQRALLLLAAACPATPRECLAGLSIGRRDAELLALRAQLFGTRLMGLAACPQCREPVELDFTVSDIQAAPASAVEELLTFSLDGYELCFRLPNSLDLAALPGDLETEESAARLRDRCVLNAEYEGAPVAAAELPDPVMDAMMDRMAQADPQADVQLALSCPACSAAWQAGFDIVSFLWAEVDAWAQRTLHEVHLLASAYGWHEPEILAMRPARRQLYLEMVNA